MTLTAMRPVAGLGKGREVMTCTPRYSAVMRTTPVTMPKISISSWRK
jgi:hypothetical protein